MIQLSVRNITTILLTPRRPAAASRLAEQEAEERIRLGNEMNEVLSSKCFGLSVYMCLY